MEGRLYREDLVTFNSENRNTDGPIFGADKKLINTCALIRHFGRRFQMLSCLFAKKVLWLMDGFSFEDNFIIYKIIFSNL
jgi:hypothetical protein